MAIFDNILFEGQQADEYKVRKAKEAADKKTAEENRNERRYGYKRWDQDTGDRYRNAPDDVRKNSSHEDKVKDYYRSNQSNFAVMRNRNKKFVDAMNNPNDEKKQERFQDMRKNNNAYVDAANRHIRRHKLDNYDKDEMREEEDAYEESCGIFESVQMI